jgi:RNA polymerase sigma-70 factor, ECF subfamily
VDAEQRRFEDAFRDHYDAVLAYALARADRETAKDAVAAAFLVAWRRRAELPERPLAWLLAVTRRTLADQRRSRERQDAVTRRLAAEPQPPVTWPDPGGQADATGVVLAALRTLRPADQELLTLVAWEGLRNSEIAVVLGCPRLAVGVRLHRARQRFRAALAAADEPGRPAAPSRRVSPAVSVTLEDK